MAENLDISVCFSANAIVTLCHARTAITSKYELRSFENEGRFELESCKQI